MTQGYFANSNSARTTTEPHLSQYRRWLGHELLPDLQPWLLQLQYVLGRGGGDGAGRHGGEHTLGGEEPGLALGQRLGGQLHQPMQSCGRTRVSLAGGW